MRTALLICLDETRSNSVIRALESEHDIWHVARQRDAIAWLIRHRPQTVIIDLDSDELDAEMLLDSISKDVQGNEMIIIGLCKNPSLLPQSIRSRLDQLA